MQITSKLFVLLFIAGGMLSAQNFSLDSLLFKESDSTLIKVLSNYQNFKVRIVYSQIDRDENNFPVFTTYQFGINDEDYFYPASTVKFPTALIALQRLKQLNVPGLNRNSVINFDSAYSGQKEIDYDSTSKNLKPSVGHYIKKLFIVSDNDAYNRLYELTGQKELNETLWKMRYADLKILHRFSLRFTFESNRFTNPYKLFSEDGEVIYSQPLVWNPTQFKNYHKDLFFGKAYYDGDSLVEKPFDFTYRNFFSLNTQQEMLRNFIFPETAPVEMRFDLTEDDYNFVLYCMSILPRESAYPSYPKKKYFDNRVKFFMFGDVEGEIPSNIRIFNKVGLAYGFVTDNAYIVDFEKKVEFFLSATIYVNENETFNDNVYEYDQIAIPFLGKLGRIIYEYESGREKKNLPILDKFILDYNDR